MSFQMLVVIVSKPLWIQMETSIDKGAYFVVSVFGADENTICMLDGVQISPKLAIEGVLYGFYECRVYKSEINTTTAIVKKRTIFKQGDNMFPTALLLFGAIASGCMLLGK